MMNLSLRGDFVSLASRLCNVFCLVLTFTKSPQCSKICIFSFLAGGFLFHRPQDAHFSIDIGPARSHRCISLIRSPGNPSANQNASFYISQFFFGKINLKIF